MSMPCNCDMCAEARRLERSMERNKAEAAKNEDLAWHTEHFNLPYSNAHICECGAEWAGSAKHSDYCPKYYKEYKD